MNFKHFYNESVIDDFGKIVSIRYMTEDELINIGMKHNDKAFAEYLDFNKGWVLRSKSDKIEKYFVIYWLPSYKSGDGSLGLTFYKPFTDAKYCNVSGPIYKNSETAKVIEHFEFKHSLNPSTVKAFEELIDEL